MVAVQPGGKLQCRAQRLRRLVLEETIGVRPGRLEHRPRRGTKVDRGEVVAVPRFGHIDEADGLEASLEGKLRLRIADVEGDVVHGVAHVAPGALRRVWTVGDLEQAAGA